MSGVQQRESTLPSETPLSSNNTSSSSRSCALCRRRKIRCNREAPCSNCLRSRASCVYETPQSRGRPVNHDTVPVILNNRGPTSLGSSTIVSGDPSSSLATSPDVKSASTPPSLSSLPDAHSQSMGLQLKRRQIEQLQRSTPPSSIQSQQPRSTTAANIQKLSTSLSGTFHVNCETGSLAQPQTIARSVAHKTRLFGQSHWAVNGVLLVSTV